MTLRYNTFAGATATIGNAENVKTPSLAEFKRAIAAVYGQLGPWQAQFQSFALSVGVDLDAGGLLVVPEDFDMRDVPPCYRLQVIRSGATFGLVRNPYGDIPSSSPTE